MNYTLYIIYADNIVVNNDVKQQQYVNYTVINALKNAAKKAALSAQNIDYVQIPLSEFKAKTKNATLKTTPSVCVQIGNQSKVTFLIGYRPESVLTQYFYDIFKTNKQPDATTNTDTGGSDSTDGAENGKENGVENGTGAGGYGRNCNAIDAFLDGLGFSSVKKFVYGAGAAFLGYKAINSPTQAGQLVQAAGAAVLGYFALTNTDCSVKKIGAIKLKTKFVPVYKNLKDKELGWNTETNIAFAQGKTGVYIIKENGKITYIGSGTNVYKNALRHFEPRKTRSGQRYDKYLDKNDYTIRIVLTNTIKQAAALEMALIRKHNPRDNYVKYELISDYDERKANTIEEEYKYWEVEAPF
jgi:hypothetical protein